MFAKHRLFATQTSPYIKGIDKPEAINISTQEGSIRFFCPPASSWRDNQEIHKKSVDLSCLSDFLPPSAELDYTENRYSYLSVFQRDWTLMGSLLSKGPVAVCTLNVRIVRIPSANAAGIYNHNFLNSACPSIMDSVVSAGLLSGADRRYSHTSNYRNSNNGRAKYQRWFFVLSKDDLLVFDFYFAYSPGGTKNNYIGLKTLSEALLGTLSIEVDPETLSKRQRFLSQYAESKGGFYDFDGQSIWIPLDVADPCDDLTDGRGFMSENIPPAV